MENSGARCRMYSMNMHNARPLPLSLYVFFSCSGSLYIVGLKCRNHQGINKVKSLRRNASEIVAKALAVTPVARSATRTACRYGEACWDTRPDHRARSLCTH